MLLLAIGAGVGVSLREARIAARRFEDVRNLSRKVIFDFNDQVRALPGSTAVREMMVTTSLEYLDRLSRDAAGDPGLEWELAKAYEKVGDLQGAPGEASLGHTAAAIESYKKSARMQEDLVRRGVLNAAQSESLARLYWQMSSAYRAAVRPAEAVQAAERGLFHARTVSDFATVKSLTILALAQMRAGEPGKARETSQTALDLLDRTAPRIQDQADGKAQMGFILTSMAIAEVRMALFEEAAAHLESAIRLKESLLTGNVLNTIAARDLVVGYDSYADILGARDRFSLGRTEEAARWYRKALDLAERLCAADPRNASARSELARSAGKLGAVLADPAMALALFERALNEAETLLPEGPQRESLRAAAYDSMAGALRRLGRNAEARKRIAAAIAISEADLDRNAGSVEALGNLADDWFDRAVIERPFDRKAALAAWRKSLEFADRIAAKTPQDFSAAFRQVQALESLIDVQDPQSAEWRERLVELWTKWDKVHPESKFIRKRLRAAVDRRNAVN